MTVCSKCGAENPEGLELCGKCGAHIESPKAQEATASTAQPAPQPEGKTFERQMDDLGKKIAGVGHKVSDNAGKRGSEFERRWYSSLGLLAPIVGGLVATVVFLIFILVVGAVAIGSDHRSFWEQLRDFCESYFLLFVGLFFLSSFTNYFNHVHWKLARWFTPATTALGFVGWFWILAQVLFIGARTLVRPGLRDLGDFTVFCLPIIFLIVLGVGYLVVLFRYMVEKSLEARPV